MAISMQMAISWPHTRLKWITLLWQAGGDSYVKGFYVFLEASQKILKKRSGVKFLLAGKFDDANKLLVKKLNERFGKAFKIFGWLGDQKLLDFYSKGRALIVPSICEEPSPYVVLEAMLTGTIPIASKTGGIPEIVEETYAEKMLFQPGNVDEMVCKIEETLQLPKTELGVIGFKLREAVLKKFDNEKIKREWARVLLD